MRSNGVRGINMCALAVTALLALSACGGEEGSTEAEESTGPSQETLDKVQREAIEDAQKPPAGGGGGGAAVPGSPERVEQLQKEGRQALERLSK